MSGPRSAVQPGAELAPIHLGDGAAAALRDLGVPGLQLPEAQAVDLLAALAGDAARREVGVVHESCVSILFNDKRIETCFYI